VISDGMWARIIAWLQTSGLVLHIPLRGPIYFTRKETR
jgi:hypothetical protein